MLNAQTALLVELLKVNQPSFISVLGYTTDKTGEIANHCLNVGRKYETAQKVAISRLESFLLTAEPNSLTFQAATELLNSAINNSNPETASNQSLAQSNAYVSLGNSRNISQHVETGEIFINCFSVGKTVLVKGEYKEVKSNAKTLEKKRIKELLKLPTEQYRRFKLTKIQGARIKGKELIIAVSEVTTETVENNEAEYFD